MNANRIVATLQIINAKLQQKQYCSAEQLRLLRKARAKWRKRLEAMIGKQQAKYFKTNTQPELNF